MSDAREFDVIVYGASGFTGRLVAEYMQRAYGAGSNVTWAMAGRDTAKLDAFAFELLTFLTTGQSLRSGAQSAANVHSLNVAAQART